MWYDSSMWENFNNDKKNHLVDKKEKCYFCDEVSTYNDIVEYAVVGVCKKHLKNYHTG